ncbi:MAG: YifB family Mg chelatase-like AAA ATPase [Steroidobacteraceae bacterium]|nr:YifB family Mg chelatase-like AAA ATPase [Steroidobacteraceae bacterium]
MQVARIASRAQLGLHAPLVHVEVHLDSGLPTFSIVGLAATAVKESKERVRSALANSSFQFPAGRITVNLSPADIPKEGGRFDLPIALALLIASGQMKLAEAAGGQALERCEFYGELALSGELKPVKGLLLAAAHAAQVGHQVIVPHENVAEACITARTGVFGARHLLEVCRHVQGIELLTEARKNGALHAIASEIHDQATGPQTGDPEPDLHDVRGQLQAKRALLIAAAGGHSLLLVGPPGSGKSMLAQRLPGLLPPLDDAEALEVAMIASASTAGFDLRTYGRRPFRSPHHSASMYAIIGGGSQARPGEVSLAHRGVLFLDELPEFDRRALEALREPMETGAVAVSRVAFQAEYPAEFQLVVAMNPCPCGYLGDVNERCECPPGRIAQYRARVSGPLLDRIDLRIVVPTLRGHELMHDLPPGESTAEAAARVRAARAIQLARARVLNARLPINDLHRFCQLDSEGEQLFWRSHARLGVSARAYHHTLRVARTIADLEGSEPIRAIHVAEALQLRRGLEPG